VSWQYGGEGEEVTVFLQVAVSLYTLLLANATHGSRSHNRRRPVKRKPLKHDDHKQAHDRRQPMSTAVFQQHDDHEQAHDRRQPMSTAVFQQLIVTFNQVNVLAFPCAFYIALYVT